MTEFFTRDGQLHNPKYAVRHENDKASFTRPKMCGRCGGAGRIACYSHVEGGICFECNGNGRVGTETVRLYTADQLVKLNATAEKRAVRQAAKYAAEQARQKAETDARREVFNTAHAAILPWLSVAGTDKEGNYREGFLGDMLQRAQTQAQWTEAQSGAVYAAHKKMLAERKKKANSKHVGTVGQRIDATVTVEREAVFYRPAFNSYNGGQEEVFVTTLRDADGNALIVKSPTFRAAVGSMIRVRGTVKAHDEFRGEMQTLLQRVKELEMAAQAA